MGLAVFKQPASLREMSYIRRWLVFFSGFLETALWSGTIFGWASLVHVLKIQGVFSHLCRDDSPEASNGTFAISLSGDGDEFAVPSPVTRGCRAQDEKFTLIGTVAMVLYSTPGILVGYGLHHLGQAFTRITSSVLISLGFALLSLTSEATPDYLWGASIFVSVGGNMIRMSCLEFGNLFPERRNTVMGIVSGIYTLSAAVFMLMQSAFEAGYRWEMICQLMAVGSSLIVVTTLFIPWHHIPHDDDAEAGYDQQLECLTTDIDKDGNKRKDGRMNMVVCEKKIAVVSAGKSSDSSQIPLSQSLFSVSMGLLQFWIFNNMFAITIFGTYFNSWISRFSQNIEEAAYYSRLFGYANILCALATPLPGSIIDALSAYFRKNKKGLDEKVANVQATIAPMMFISLTITVQISCFFFFTSWAVYVALFFLIFNRPGCLGVGIPFMRARFPADHFNRLIGIQGTLIAILATLQYPHFTWSQTQYFWAMWLVVIMLFLSVVHPLHLLNKRYLYRTLDWSSHKKEDEAP
ncbi:equilibrative nucleobase transporter 1-like [Macrobrachium nipponense]|uniref:equilibrative nucleobase transporter 1-like n=1 Tax=Macrobrachium nipponense TaxID=159736 RepID=UPI0030C83A43